MSDGLFSEVAATFAGWERDRDLSGSCLVTRGGETLFEASWGFADIAARVPNLPSTRFGLASLTKMFTAVVVATLVRDHRLAFETPVVEILPANLRPRGLAAAVDPATAPRVSDRAGRHQLRAPRLVGALVAVRAVEGSLRENGHGRIRRAQRVRLAR